MSTISAVPTDRGRSRKTRKRTRSSSTQSFVVDSSSDESGSSTYSPDDSHPTPERAEPLSTPAEWVIRPFTRGQLRQSEGEGQPFSRVKSSRRPRPSDHDTSLVEENAGKKRKRTDRNTSMSSAHVSAPVAAVQRVPEVCSGEETDDCIVYRPPIGRHRRVMSPPVKRPRQEPLFTPKSDSEDDSCPSTYLRALKRPDEPSSSSACDVSARQDVVSPPAAPLSDGPVFVIPPSPISPLQPDLPTGVPGHPVPHVPATSASQNLSHEKDGTKNESHPPRNIPAEIRANILRKRWIEHEQVRGKRQECMGGSMLAASAEMDGWVGEAGLLKSANSLGIYEANIVTRARVARTETREYSSSPTFSALPLQEHEKWGQSRSRVPSVRKSPSAPRQAELGVAPFRPVESHCHCHCQRDISKQEDKMRREIGEIKDWLEKIEQRLDRLGECTFPRLARQ